MNAECEIRIPRTKNPALRPGSVSQSLMVRAYVPGYLASLSLVSEAPIALNAESMPLVVVVG